MIVYILTKYQHRDDEFGDEEPQIVGVTQSAELADRWKATTSYIQGEIHEYRAMGTKYADKVVSDAEETERQRAKEYEEAMKGAQND